LKVRPAISFHWRARAEVHFEVEEVLGADRIQAKAIRRCGELLKEVAKQHGANQNIKGGAPPQVTRKSVAESAGLSDDQRKTALRVANVPKKEKDPPPFSFKLFIESP